MSPEATPPRRVRTASVSASVNAVSSPCSGKPSARHSRRASSTPTPVRLATSCALKDGASPRIALSRSSGLGAASGSFMTRRGVVDLLQHLVDLALRLLDLGDVVQP